MKMIFFNCFDWRISQRAVCTCKYAVFGFEIWNEAAACGGKVLRGKALGSVKHWSLEAWTGLAASQSTGCQMPLSKPLSRARFCQNTAVVMAKPVWWRWTGSQPGGKWDISCKDARNLPSFCARNLCSVALAWAWHSRAQGAAPASSGVSIHFNGAALS